MQTNTKLILFGVGFAALVALAFIGTVKTKPQPSAQTQTASTSATGAASTSESSVLQGQGGVYIQGSGGIIRQVPLGSAPTAPNFKASLVFSSSISEDERTALQADFGQVQTLLAKNPQDFNAWLELGTIRRMAGDFTGAAAAWEYVAALYSSSPTPLENLGQLYMTDLKNYPKAETYFKQLITISPSNLHAYQDLYSLYTAYGYKAGTAAEDILKQGIAANPKAVDLYLTLARYYGGKGNADGAKVQYEAAIGLAQAAGNAVLAEQIKTEESAPQ